MFPISDLPKYRKMYRTQPDIQQAVQMQVNLALGKGYTIGHDDEDVVTYLEKAVNKIDLSQKMLVMGTDCLVYGNSYTEIQWDKTSQKKEQMYEYEGCYYTKNDLEKLEIKKAKPASIDTPIYNAEKDGFEFKGAKKNFVAQVTEKVPEAKTIVGLKCLDPLYVRVRRDSYGNQYGFIQWIGFPPVIMDNESCFQIKYRPQSWGYEDVYGCVEKGTKVLSNPGLKNIEDLHDGDWVYSYKDGKLVKAQIEKVLSYGEQDAYKIKTQHRNLVATDKHPFMVLKETRENIPYDSTGRIHTKREFIWKSVKDLSNGDKIVILKKYPEEIGKEIPRLKTKFEVKTRCIWLLKEPKLPEYPTNEFCRLFGFLLGDGWLHQNTVSFAKGIYEDQNEKYKNIMELIFDIKGKDTGQQYVFRSKILRRFFEENGFINGCFNKRIPKWAFELPEEMRKEFVFGFVDADGWETHSREYQGYHVSINNKKLLEDLKILIDSIGFKCGNIRTSIASKPGCIRGRTFKTNNPTFTISFYPTKIKGFGDLSNRKKHLIDFETFAYEKVVSKNFVGKKEVFDLCVPETSNYIANGIITHNSSILMPIIKNNELLMQFENDGATWIHSKAVPPLIIKGGTELKPYSTQQMTDLMGALKSRTAATMIFTKGDVSFEEFKTIASDLNLTWWLDFLLLRRYQSLGVPPILMGYVKAGARGIAEVVLHDFVARLQVLQEFIADPIEEYIFKPLIKARFGDDVENAEIIWKPIIEEDKNMRSQRLIQMLQAGAISVNELRVEQGFKQLEDKKYDEVNVVEPGMQPSGFPPKPGAAAAPPKGGGPETNRVNQQTKKPPESHMKLEDIKTKKIQLLQLEESFRTKMLDLTSKTKFDLKDDGKLVKQVKQEATESAKDIINEHVAASYLVGRLSANASIGVEDDLSLKQEDLEHLAKLKQLCIADFDKIVNDMVIMKEEGKLE